MALPPPVVAVLNTSPDIVDMLRVALEHAGIVVVSTLTHLIRDGPVDIERFIEQHQPGAILYDVAPPYDANWQLFEHIRQMSVMRDRPFIVTSTNARQIEKLAANSVPVYEIVGKPYDIDRIVNATREALNAQPTK